MCTGHSSAASKQACLHCSCLLQVMAPAGRSHCSLLDTLFPHQRPTLQVLKLKCMQGARVAVNGQPQGSHHSGILEKDGKEVRCEQCAEEGLAAAAKANGHSWTWTPLQALQHACWKRGRFAWHCTGLDKSKHPDVLELVDVRLSLRVRGHRGPPGVLQGWSRASWSLLSSHQPSLLAGYAHSPTMHQVVCVQALLSGPMQ
jgi:hypothetical protein